MSVENYNSVEEFTIHDTNPFPQGSQGILVTASTAGALAITDALGNAVTVGVAIGTWVLPIRGARLVKSTGTTAVLVPATKVHALSNVAP